MSVFENFTEFRVDEPFQAVPQVVPALMSSRTRCSRVMTSHTLCTPADRAAFCALSHLAPDKNKA